MRLGKSNLSAVEKITIVLMNLLHLPISALFHQDIILHIQAVYQWQVRSMHSLIRVWFLNPFRLPNSHNGRMRGSSVTTCSYLLFTVLSAIFLILLRGLLVLCFVSVSDYCRWFLHHPHHARTIGCFLQKYRLLFRWTTYGYLHSADVK